MRGQERFEQPPRRVIDGDDVELEVDEPFCSVDGIGHRLHAGVVVDVEVEGVAVRHRQGTEVEVELRGSAQGFGHMVLAPDDRLVADLIAEEVIHLRLLVPPPLRQLRRTQQQEGRNAHIGDEEDREQPAERDRRPAIVRNPPERDDADDQIDQQQDDDHPVRPSLVDREERIDPETAHKLPVQPALFVTGWVIGLRWRMSDCHPSYPARHLRTRPTPPPVARSVPNALDPPLRPLLVASRAYWMKTSIAESEGAERDSRHQP